MFSRMAKAALAVYIQLQHIIRCAVAAELSEHMCVGV